MIPKPAAIILQTGQFPLALYEESVHDGLIFIGYGMDRNCLKIVNGDYVLKKCENQNDWLDYWSGRKKLK